MVPDSTFVPSSTTAPAAMMEFLPISALSIIMAPMPTSTLSWIVQPWIIALWPMETQLPMVTEVFLYVPWTTTPSWIFTLSPMVILLTSPRTTALNQMLQSSPMVTSPTTVALGARKQFFPNWGD